MNATIFMNHIQKQVNSDLWKKILKEEPIASLILIHLLSENLLEAWICAYLDIPDLFINSKEEKNKARFSLQFSTKLKLAQRTGLPMEAYNALDKLNDVRNKIAHNLDTPIIEDSIVEAILIQVNLIQTDNYDSIEKFKMEQIKEDNSRILYDYSDKSTSNIIKLTIIYQSLFYKLVDLVRKSYFE